MSTAPLSQPIPLRRETPLGKVFGCDTRSLAVFRIALGAVLLTDLVFRSTSLTAMYTDDGYLTRDLAETTYQVLFDSQQMTYWSLHKLSGEIGFQIGLFVVAGLFSLMLMCGCFTRLATIASFIFLASLQARNPLVTTSGDMLLRMLVFWSIFLPLGRIWSIDAWRKGRRYAPNNNRVVSMATAGIIIQLCLMYWFTGISKWNTIWFSGEAMDYVLHLDIYTTAFGRRLLDYPVLLFICCWSTVLGEIFLPLLLFVPWKTPWFRLLNIAAFWALHLLIMAAMTIGLFSLISMIGWLPLVPALVWDSRPARSIGRMFIGLKPKWAFPARAHVEPVVATLHKAEAWVSNGVCAFFLVYVVCWNIANINLRVARMFMPPSLSWIGYRLNVYQHFQMFSIPPTYSPWFVYEARLVDGSVVDVMRNGAPADHSRPPSIRATMPSFHWRKLHRNLSAMRNSEPMRAGLADYAFRYWNSSQPPEKQIEKLTLYCYMDEIGPHSNRMDGVTEIWGVVDAKPHEDTVFDRAFEEIINKDGKIFP